jgi:uncharacterized membrane protein HdeD (DUF308 family)
MTVGPKPPALRWRRWLWLAVVLLLAIQLWTDPRDAGYLMAAVLGSIVLLVGLVFAIQHIELRTQRPRKTYLRWVLAVAVLGLALVVMPLAIGAGIAIGLILWVGFSATGFVWVWYYERTEPL